MLRSAILAAVLLASYAYFYSGGGANQNTRLDLVRAILEEQTVRIDTFHTNTGDKAEHGGHFYSDKAPGASLTAVPAVALARGAAALAGSDLQSARTIMWLSYVATLVSASLPAVFAALCVFWIARGVGVSDAGAAFAAVVCALGTPLWAYGSILYGHALAAGCLMAAFWGAGRLPASARRPALGLFIGFAAGWAVVAEYPAAVAAVVIGGFSVWQVRRGPRAQAAATIAAISLGAAVAAACLLFYNRMAFGSMFHIGYASEVPGFEEMQRGIFGISWPTVHVMGAVVIGQYRGLLPLAPVLIAAPLGLWMLVRSGSTRAVGVTAAVVAGVYYLMASGYAYWNGGWSYGPRHLGPAIPFLCVGLAVIWQRASRPWRIALAVLAVISIGETLVAVATTPQPTTNVSNPMRDLLWPAFASGEFPIGWQSVLDFRPPEGTSTELLRAGVPRPSWNLGQQLGLHGHASLLPLMFIWLLGVLAWRRTAAA